MGNELGVGEFCNSSSDCHGPMARLCASLGDPGLHFCTMTCRPPSEGGVPEGGVPEGGMLEGGVAEGGLPEGGPTCGTGATCKCQGAECGCIPNTCL
jgi:hypothetical protein